MSYIGYEKCIVEINGEKVFAINASISAASNSQENITYGGEMRGRVPRFFNQPGDEGNTLVRDYAAEAPLESSLSLRYYITGEEDPIASLTGEASCQGKFGGISFSGAYLTSYAMRMEPYKPIIHSADFRIFSGFKNQLKEESFGDQTDQIDLSNGSYSELSNFNQQNIGMKFINSVDYYISCERLPSYVVGEEFPEYVIQGKILKSLRVEGENIGDVITYTGKKITKLEISPKTIGKEARGKDLFCSGVLVYQNVNVSKNDFLAGGVEVIESVK